MNFIRTGFRELGLKVRRQRTGMALRHEKRVLQRAEVALGREGVNQAGNVPELRTEIVALKKLEQEQREVAVRISQIEAALKQLETQRQENARAQQEAVSALEQRKQPILQRRDEARKASDLCDRELSGVDRRLSANDATDRDLLKKLTELQAQVPPPADLDTQTATLGVRRGRLPEERAEIERARLGAAEACRQAKTKLTACQGELDVIEKEIAAVRGEFEAKDRALNENSRAQQETLKEARAQHQTVEERKNPAYLNIGRHLGSQGIAPPNAPHLLEEVQRHRAAVERHTQHKRELAVLSAEIDKQELRKFYFSIFSVLVLLPIIVFFVMQSPRQRDWLPQETEAIMSLNLQQLPQDDFVKRWEKERAPEWQSIWAGLTSNAGRTPALNLVRDATRLTRALTSGHAGAVREFLLVQTKGDVAPVLRAVVPEQGFERRAVSGLPIWVRSDFALARVGPRTLAVGTFESVEELVRVRLGIRPDLKITGSLFDRLEALDKETSVRLIARDPASLAQFFPAIFKRELLEVSQTLAFGLALGNPVKGRLILRTKSPKIASDLAEQVRTDPERYLRLENSDYLLYAQPPEVVAQGTGVEIRFEIPENSARLLLQRFARNNAPPAVAAAGN